jgi:hypothetical protein
LGDFVSCAKRTEGYLMDHESSALDLRDVCGSTPADGDSGDAVSNKSIKSPLA